MHEGKRPQPLPPTALLKAARRVLRPLVRLMMLSGVTFPIVADTLRRLFVDVAVNEILTDPKTRTDSRISILTGVHRKEIKRLRSLQSDPAAAPEVVTLASQIIARWLGTPECIDGEGRPRPLPRIPAVAGPPGPSFESLVLAVTSDIRPRAVLDDLLDHGVVTLEPNDVVRLDAAGFIPRPGGEEQLFYFARNLHDHAAAAVMNISAAGAAPFIDRSVHYDGLTRAQADALEAYAREAAMRALLAVNRHAMELTADDAGTAGPDPRRVNFGVYVFGDQDTGAGA